MNNKKTYYHVTQARNLGGILSKGLLCRNPNEYNWNFEDMEIPTGVYAWDNLNSARVWVYDFEEEVVIIEIETDQIPENDWEFSSDGVCFRENILPKEIVAYYDYRG